MTLEEYLDKIAETVDNRYGKQIRSAFRDHRGSSELAMLKSPSADELAQLKKALAIMTENEKQNAANLSDDQIHSIAEDAHIEPALLAIFLNGYTLQNKNKP